MNEPQDPTSVFAGHSIALHEYYTACIDAGFNQDQAFQLTLKFTEMCSASMLTSMMLGRDPSA